MTDYTVHWDGDRVTVNTASGARVLSLSRLGVWHVGLAPTWTAKEPTGQDWAETRSMVMIVYGVEIPDEARPTWLKGEARPSKAVTHDAIVRTVLARGRQEGSGIAVAKALGVSTALVSQVMKEYDLRPRSLVE